MHYKTRITCWMFRKCDCSLLRIPATHCSCSHKWFVCHPALDEYLIGAISRLHCQIWGSNNSFATACQLSTKGMTLKVYDPSYSALMAREGSKEWFALYFLLTRIDHYIAWYDYIAKYGTWPEIWNKSADDLIRWCYDFVAVMELYHIGEDGDLNHDGHSAIACTVFPVVMIRISEFSRAGMKGRDRV